MGIVTVTLWLLLLMSFSRLIAQALPAAFPLPLLQIILGVGAGYVASFPKITLDPELFMILFIPPLLFLDSWQLPQREFFRLKKAIFGLAVGLTFLNVVIGGYLIHRWLAPLPLRVSFVLAAILSPTDVVAVMAITKRLPLSSTVHHLLAGESLINDASSLIALKFALAAMITGTFSFGVALQQFVWISGGGIALGMGLSYLFNQLRAKLIKPQLTLHAPQTLLLFLLLPFGTYLSAEHYGLSGILAVVAAGMSLSHLKNIHADSSTARLQARSFWPFLEFIFNGLIFLLLGLQIPKILNNLSQEPLMEQSTLPLLMAIGGITLLLLLRLAWLVVPLLLARWMGRSTTQAPLINPANLGSITFSGIRGAITLAAALSLPMNLPDGTPFPARALLVGLAVGVILSTLLLGALVLPFCATSTSSLATAESEQSEERQARCAAWQAALLRIEENQQRYHTRLTNHRHGPQLLERFNTACDGLKQFYRQQQQADSAKEEDNSKIHQTLANLTQRLQRDALQAERHTLYQLRQKNSINDVTWRKLEREIDLRESLLEQG